MSSSAPAARRERQAGIGLAALAALLTLDAVKGFGPAAFRALHDAGSTPRELLEDPARLELPGKRGETLRNAIAALSAAERELAADRAQRQFERALELGVRILTYSDPLYPANLYESNGPVPLLYARGDIGILARPEVVACVGSRKIRAPYGALLATFARLAGTGGWTIASGFANGADTIAHQAAVDAGGHTVLVMPSGIDIPFPPENRELWKSWLERPGVAVISEFPLGTKASSLTLRKRNKTIVGVSLAVLIAQTSEKGGTMNAYRFAREQKKPVLTFPADNQADTAGNRRIEREDADQLDIAGDGLAVVGDPYQQLRTWLEKARSSST